MFTGWQLGLRAKASSGKSRLSYQRYFVTFSTNMHVYNRCRDKIRFRADLSTCV